MLPLALDSKIAFPPTAAKKLLIARIRYLVALTFLWETAIWESDLVLQSFSQGFASLLSIGVMLEIAAAFARQVALMMIGQPAHGSDSSEL